MAHRLRIEPGYRALLAVVLAAGLACAACPAVAAGNGGADNTADLPYVGAGFQYGISDHARHSDNGIGFRLGAGVPLAGFGFPHNALELNFIGMQRKRHIDGKHDYSSFVMFDLVHDFGLFGWSRDSWLPDFTPFVLGGLGVVWDSAHGHTAAHPALDLGAGLLFPLHLPVHGFLHRLTQDWAVRTEVRFMGQQNHSSAPSHDFLVDWHFGIGLQIPLRFFANTGGAVSTPPPATPVKVVPVAPEVTGPDYDGDGVPNSTDKCPNSPAGMEVDGDGCIVSQTVLFPAVRFASSSSGLTVQARAILDQFAGAFKRHPGMKAEVRGYTDNTGNASANMALSRRRAKKVVKYLESRGVAASGLSDKGLGEADPIASNDTLDGRAENRRVVFKVTVPAATP